LIGEGGVQSPDDDAHRERKAMFMSLMTPESIERLIDLADGEWRRAIVRWSRDDEVELFRAVNEVQETHFVRSVIPTSTASPRRVAAQAEHPMFTSPPQMAR
jgi:hypothetical protein